MTTSQELEAAPAVTLGGKTWKIPPLAVRQNKLIDPLLLDLIQTFAQWQTDKIGAMASLSREKYESLLTACFIACTRAEPELKRQQFEDLPITLPEMIAAYPVIAQQTGLFKEKAPGAAEGSAAAGEASAA